MRKNRWYQHIALGFAALFASCTGMNDKLDEYLVGGERIYIGKIDSLKTFAGDGRIKLRFWASDPRAKTAGFYWYPNNDSLIVEISRTSAIDSFDVFIGGSSSLKKIEEGNYTLKVITRDLARHFSIPYEKVFNIYGDKFRSILTNRILTTTAYQITDSSLSLTFSGSTNDKEIGIEISYTDKTGVAKTLVLENKEITTPVKLLNVDKTKTVSYRTMFLPEPLAIDIFYALSKTVNIP